jgi:micrococcal nuclease
LKTRIRRRSVPAVLFFILSFIGALYASSCCAWEGKVVAVTDGDTFTVMHEGKRERVHLYGVVCPEKRQDFGQAAKQTTSDLVSGKSVEVEPVVIDRKGHTKDQFGRTSALVYTGDHKCLNAELTRSGFAWVYNQNCARPECKEWKELEKQAKKQRAGLWSVPNPIPPWEFSPKREVQIPVYHGDIVRHIFHSSNCLEFDCKNCIAVFKGRDQAIRAGYKPCDICRP